MKKFFLPAMLALLIFTAGCEQPPSDTPPAPPPDKPATTAPDKKPDLKPDVKPSSAPNPSTPESNSPEKTEQSVHTMNIKVYYPDDSGMRLVEVEREITVNDMSEKYAAAVEVLRNDPVEENLTRIFPSNAKLHGVTVDDNMATVDFDGGILKSFVGGSTGEEFLIGSIVDTLTNFPEVTSVKFLVDGQDIETLSGHMDLSMPLERMNDLTE